MINDKFQMTNGTHMLKTRMKELVFGMIEDFVVGVLSLICIDTRPVAGCVGSPDRRQAAGFGSVVPQPSRWFCGTVRYRCPDFVKTAKQKTRSARRADRSNPAGFDRVYRGSPNAVFVGTRQATWACSFWRTGNSGIHEERRSRGLTKLTERIVC